MHVIIDYDVGNLASVKAGWERAGIRTVISSDKDVIKQADTLILPGVGAFEASMKALRNTGLIPTIKAHVKKGKYLFGICLGMQLLYEVSYEFGTHKGLGMLPGSIEFLDKAPKVPHMGWNNLTIEQAHPLTKYLNSEDYVYFVHSYYVKTGQDDIVASTTYGNNIPAIVAHKNVFATQFHPEKSGPVGRNILKAYKELIT